MLHPDFNYGLGRERMVEMRAEVGRNRLEARLAKARLSEGDRSSQGALMRRGVLACGTAFVTALFR